MNIKDIKILRELDLNPKVTTSKIGKSTRLGQQVVDYRINKLVERGIINQFSTILNLATIGYGQYRVLFQFNKINETDKKIILNYFQKHPLVYWAAVVGNKWDLLVTVFAKNNHEFENFLDNLFEKFKTQLKDYAAFYVTLHEFYKHKFLHGEKFLKPIVIDYGDVEKKFEYDELDIKILDHIKDNCRLSSLQIGKLCHVNYKTIQNRIKNMEEKGLISGYRIFIKSEEEKPCLLLISFTTYGREVEKKLIAHARTDTNITQTIKIFGSGSLLLHLRVKNEIELQKKIIELREKFDIVGEYEIIPIFEDISINNFPMAKEIN